MTLGDLIDLEYRFAEDRELDRQTLRERDREIGRRLLAESEHELDNHELFRRWLKAVAQTPDATVGPGARVMTVYRVVGYLLALTGLLSGSAAASAILHYDGTQPVNLVHVLAVFVIAQLGLCLLSILAMLPSRLFSAGAGFGPLHETLRNLCHRRSGLNRAFGAVNRNAASLEGAAARLSSWSAVYGEVERWLLLSLTQRVGFFFNLGVLITFVYLIVVTDLAFAWSTTLRIDSDAMTRIVHGVSLPWSWLTSAVPSAELVEASRYFRQSSVHDPSLLKDWWAFLVAALITYGLLPRTVLWIYSMARLRSARAGVPLDHGDAQSLRERLSSARVGWVADSATSSSAGTSATNGDDLDAAAPEPLSGNPGAGCIAIAWADMPVDRSGAARLIERRFGWRLESFYEAGGVQRTSDRSMRAAVESADHDTPIVIVAESFEAPTKALAGTLRALREAGGRQRPIVVVLIAGERGQSAGPEQEDLRMWQSALARLSDPYIRVEWVDLEPVTAARGET